MVKRNATKVQKTSILTRAAGVKPSKGGPENWLGFLKRTNSPFLKEAVALVHDWASGERKYTRNHTRSSLAKFICSLDCCDRKVTGIIEFLRKAEAGEVNANEYL